MDSESHKNAIATAASAGDAAAQHQLGLQYFLGAGVERDYAQALQWFDQAVLRGVNQALYGLLQIPLQWFRNAAVQGNPTAQYYLGMMYCHGEHVLDGYPLVGLHVQGIVHQGECVEQDYAQALEWFHKAVAQGDGRAQLALGWMYAEGKGVAKDVEQAQQCYAEAAAKGFISPGQPAPPQPACQTDYGYESFSLGEAYFYGDGVQQDYTQALHWFEQAAAQGCSEAMDKLAEMYREGQGVGQDYLQVLHWRYEAAEQWASNPLHVVLRELRLPLQWYVDAAQQGHSVAQYILGLMYQYGVSVSWDDGGQAGSLRAIEDEEQALEWFLKAAAQGHADAQYETGWMYCDGLGGVDQDFTQALHWLEKAAAQGRSDKDELTKLRAVQPVEELARTGDATGQYSMGMILRQGYLDDGYVADNEQTLAWFDKAAAQGHAKAQYNMGMFQYGASYLQRDIGVARQWFGKAAVGGSAAAQDMLNWFAAAEQIQQDAQAGKAAAQSQLGFMYLQGRYVEQDHAQALAWFHKAAAQGDAAAYFGLGEMCVVTDRQQALAWFSKAAKYGYLKVFGKLGELYRSDRTYAEALQWYRKAAAQGDADAMLALGWMYTWGEGVPQDKELAMRWFERAAERGHKEAQAICRNRRAIT
ncbi:SEL1-like repeat protein [Thiothrix nivea]|uniref:Sel1 domain protein repeat-containing protein n=1 Tax=Thiothrix nivea (strain ATCC 35100 / DSM 5205 / JP2) TaxID=870187 RepID=A0A656HGV0_THINJ|nr:tetratricopeptide repeat protein [Thiothrix nivea]EIJ34419.1 Sel1 domain protein repeat-containing protein [Thiothrix nivea DSM 5205]